MREAREEFGKIAVSGGFHVSQNVPLTGCNFDKIWNWHISQLQSVFEEIGVEIEIMRGHTDNKIDYMSLYEFLNSLCQKYLGKEEK